MFDISKLLRRSENVNLPSVHNPLWLQNDSEEMLLIPTVNTLAEYVPSYEVKEEASWW